MPRFGDVCLTELGKWSDVKVINSKLACLELGL